jgi:hypothetical protein
MLTNEGKRALAYIVKVDDILPIAGADNIALAVVGGWKVIVKKEEIAIGEKGVYFEIDSKVPSDDERFAFLENKDYRIKTMKLNKFGVYSQGLLIPLSHFPELGDLEVNTDVTDALKVIYYVPADNERKANAPDPNAKYKSMASRHPKLAKKKWFRWLMKREWGKRLLFFFFGKKKDTPKGWPTHFPFIHKTDEERCENLPQMLGYPHPLTVTEKLDGTSTTFILERKGKNKFEFYVLSRNVRQKDEKQSCYHDHNIYWDMAFKYNIEDVLREILQMRPDLKYVCIQGESVGSVQGNPLKLPEDDFYAFNFIDSENGRWPSYNGSCLLAKYGIKWVPILDTNFMMPNDMEEFKQMATAPSAVNPNVMREGIVLRDPTNDFSFKNVSREYLMKHNG